MSTKERILEGSRELFFRFGLKSITMDDIARHLGMSKKTIYQFFEDKNELIVTLNEQELKFHEKHFTEISASAKNAIDEIFQMMHHLERLFSDMNPILMLEMQRYYSQAWKMHLAFKEKCVFPRMEHNIRRGIEEGLYRPDINVRLMVITRLEMFNMAFNYQVINPSQFNIGDVHVQLLDHFLHGISTLKGHKLINKYKQIQEEE